MSTIKTTYIQHPSSPSPNLELAADGTISLPLSGIGDLADVDEGSGAADGDVLTYDGVSDLWVPAAGIAGIGTNVVQTVKTDTFTTTSNTYTPITGLTATITPTSATSKVLVIATVSIANDPVAAEANVQLVRDSTAIFLGDAAGNRVRATSRIGPVSATTTSLFSVAFLDSPATTSATVYSVEIARHYASGTLYVNKAHDDSDSTNRTRMASSLTAIEVAA